LPIVKLEGQLIYGDWALGIITVKQPGWRASKNLAERKEVLSPWLGFTIFPLKKALLQIVGGDKLIIPFC